MNCKKILLLILGLIVLSMIVGISIFFINNKSEKSEIPNNWIVSFHGGSGEVTYTTYVYKINNGQDNYGFNYINVTYVTEHWGSTNLKAKITKRGSVSWTDDVFLVAKDNNAYSYVILPNDSKIYSIDDFMGMFLMN